MYRIMLFLFTLFTFLHADLTILHSSTTGEVKHSNIPDLEKIQNVADSSNIKVTFKPMPWKRALLMVKSGAADGVINASYKEDRAKYAVYPMKDGKADSSRRLNPGSTYSIYKNKNSTLKWDGKKFTSVDGGVGTLDGFAVIGDLKKHSNILIVTKSDRLELLRDVASGEIAAFAAIEANVDKILKSYIKLNEKIIKEPIPIRNKDYFVIFSKKSYEHKHKEIDIIWNGLKQK